MPLFSSQFEAVRPFTRAYAGTADDQTLHSPKGLAGPLAIGIGAEMVTAGLIATLRGGDGPSDEAEGSREGSANAGAGAEGAGSREGSANADAEGAGAGEGPEGEAAGAEPAHAGWGDGWDAGWDVPGADASDPGAGTGGDEAWMHRGDVTDAGVGGDGDFVYFIDGDSSATVD
jgi:hypothetical protein